MNYLMRAAGLAVLFAAWLSLLSSGVLLALGCFVLVLLLVFRVIEPFMEEQQLESAPVATLVAMFLATVFLLAVIGLSSALGAWDAPVWEQLTTVRVGAMLATIGLAALGGSSTGGAARCSSCGSDVVGRWSILLGASTEGQVQEAVNALHWNEDLLQSLGEAPAGARDIGRLRLGFGTDWTQIRIRQCEGCGETGRAIFERVRGRWLGSRLIVSVLQSACRDLTGEDLLAALRSCQARAAARHRGKKAGSDPT